MKTDYYKFQNREGAVIELRGDLTVEDLIRMGFTDIRMAKLTPLTEDNVWRAVDEKIAHSLTASEVAYVVSSHTGLHVRTTVSKDQTSFILVARGQYGEDVPSVGVRIGATIRDLTQVIPAIRQKLLEDIAASAALKEAEAKDSTSSPSQE